MENQSDQKHSNDVSSSSIQTKQVENVKAMPSSLDHAESMKVIESPISDKLLD